MTLEYSTPVTMDLNEGRFLEIGCLDCKQDVRATLTIATPFRMYVVALSCDDCGEQIVEIDQFMGVNRTWKETQ